MLITHADMFAGVGGTCIAAEWAGFETVALCEIAPYPQSVLRTHWPDVPLWGDIKTFGVESFYERTGLRTVDILTASLPCQPFSVAGKREGQADPRYLWPELLRVVKELRPRWVVVENVPGILNIAADGICTDLEQEGYEVGILDFEAAAVGAPHRRERVAFVGVMGDAKYHGPLTTQERGGRPTNASGGQEGSLQTQQPTGASTTGGDETMDHPECGGRGGVDGRRDGQEFADGRQTLAHAAGQQYWYDVSPIGSTVREDVGVEHEGVHGGDGSDDARRAMRPTEPRLGVAPDGLSGWVARPVNPWLAPWDDIPRAGHKIPKRVDRLKALGNAVVPQWAYPIFGAIMFANEGRVI